MPSVAIWLAPIEAALRALADAQQAVPMKAYMLDQFAFLGIRAGPRRDALKGLMKFTGSADELLALAEAMPHLGYLSPTKGGTGIMPRHYYLDLATWHRINALYTARTASDLKALRHEADRPELLDRMMRVVDGRHGHAVAIEVERVKIELSDTEAARLMLAPMTKGPNPVARRDRFEAAVEAPVARIDGLISQTLAEAGLTADRIATVFLTGGSSQLPLLRATVARALPAARLATGDMLGSVGTGLALDARRRFG